MDNNIVIQFPITTKTDEGAIQEMIAGLEILINIGAIKPPIDDILNDYEINLKMGYTKAYIDKDALVDASKLNTAGASEVFEVPQEYMPSVDLANSDKTFSTTTIQERLRLKGMEKKASARQMIMDYKKYYNTKKRDFEKNPDKFFQLKRMFFVDLMGILTDILPEIENGKQINSLIGLSQIGSAMTNVAKDLSLAYKRAMTQKKSSGQIGKTNQQNLENAWNNFLNQLSEIIFQDYAKLIPESAVEDDDNSNLLIQQVLINQSEKLSDTKKQRIKLFSNNNRIKLFG